MAEQIRLSQETIDGLTEICRQCVDATQRMNEIFADYRTNVLAPAVQAWIDSFSNWYASLPVGVRLYLKNYQARDYFTAMLDTGEDAETL